MTLNLITLATVKAQLGISNSEQDIQISAMLPIVSADVRRILNTQFDSYSTAVYASGSTDLNTYAPGVSDYRKSYGDPTSLKMGCVVTGENIQDDTYIVSQNPDTGVYTMSQEATGSGDYVYPTINVSQWPTISKMIAYRISKATQSTAGEKTITSKSIGGVSVSYGDGEINKKWNYPQTLIDDLGFPYAEVG
jgi:hypothetical protein